MKKVFFTLLTVAGMLFAGDKASAQIKVGVFDLDEMVQVMPGYRVVDSLLRIYQADSLGAEYQIYLSEYQRLDSTLKSDSVKGTPKAKMDFENQQKQQAMAYLVNWQQYGNQKLEAKRGQLAQNLYQQVQASYVKILEAKKYTLILKPGAYEFGSKVDNLFISVAKDLKLTELPQELLVLGPDPDAPAQGSAPANNATPNNTKPANTKPTSH
jgi:Skp family chaperone for outer membrane proteins